LKKELFRERPVFATYTGETSELQLQMLSHDKNLWDLKTVCASPQEYSALEMLIYHNMHFFTDAYHELQA